MGIRSDVALAIKNQAFLSLSEISKQTISDWFDKPVERDHDEGATLFVATDVKWYNDMFNDLMALYQDLLKNIDDEDYYLIKACPEYPGDDSSDIGGWYENPFGIHKCVSVSIERY